MNRIRTHSGRKKAALLYVVTYIASCITKHSPDYYILMLGRFFGGIATSLLFSAFESWLVAEHFKVPPTMLPHRPCLDPSLLPLPRRRRAKPTRVGFSPRAPHEAATPSPHRSTHAADSAHPGEGAAGVQRGFEASWLSMTFSKAVFLGNGLVAIVSGLLANYLVDDMQLGPTAPFDAAAVLLAVGGVVVHTTWTENYGEASENGTLLQSFSKAAKAIASDRKVFLLGAMQALFEGSMYTFVFLWTPALSPNGEDIPHGCVRAGSAKGGGRARRFARRFAAHGTRNPAPVGLEREKLGTQSGSLIWGRAAAQVHLRVVHAGVHGGVVGGGAADEQTAAGAGEVHAGGVRGVRAHAAGALPARGAPAPSLCAHCHTRTQERGD